jgi:hypothetical protein
MEATNTRIKSEYGLVAGFCRQGSVTYGMRKSLCKVTLDMYQGALASFLIVLD